MHTEALETKSVTETTFPVWASTNASNQAPVSSFSIWITCVSTTVLSSLTRYSRVGGNWLKVPESVDSAEAMASSRATEGVDEAMLTVYMAVKTGH